MEVGRRGEGKNGGAETVYITYHHSLGKFANFRRKKGLDLLRVSKYCESKSQSNQA